MYVVTCILYVTFSWDEKWSKKVLLLRIIVIFCGMFSTSWKFVAKIFIRQSVFHSFSSLFFESQYKDIIKARGLSWIFLQYREEKLYRINCIYYFFLQGVAESCLAIFLPALVMGNFMVLNLFLALLLNSFNCEELKSRKEVRKIKEYCR